MMLFLLSHVILLLVLILTLSGDCYAGTLRFPRAVPEKNNYLILQQAQKSSLEQDLDGLPFNNEECPWGQIPHPLGNGTTHPLGNGTTPPVGNGTRCCQMASCGPGYEVEMCDRAGGRDQCTECQANFRQLNNVSSLNIVDSKCFIHRPAESKKCTWKEMKEFGSQFSQLCPMWCECSVENCYYKADSCSCEKVRQACHPGTTMNPSTGVCEKCPWGSYKNYTGCGPCTLNLTLISLGKPTKGPETITTQSPGMPLLEDQTQTVPSVIDNSAFSPGKINQTNTNEAEETQGVPTIVIIVGVSVVAILVIVPCVCCLVKRGHLTLPSCCPCGRSIVYESTINCRTSSTGSDTPSRDDSKALLSNNNTIRPITNQSNGVSPKSSLTTENLQALRQNETELEHLLDNQAFVASRQNSTLDGSSTTSSPGMTGVEVPQLQNNSGVQNINFSGTFNNCNFNFNQSPSTDGSPPKYPKQPPLSRCSTCTGDDCSCQTSVKTASSYIRLNSESTDPFPSDRFNSLPEPVSTASRDEGNNFEGCKRDDQHSSTEDENSSMAGSHSGSQASSSVDASLRVTSNGNEACSGKNQNSIVLDTMKNYAVGELFVSPEKMEQDTGVSRNDGELSNSGRREDGGGVHSPGRVSARPGRGGNVNLPNSPIQPGTRQIAEVRPMTLSGNFAAAAAAENGQPRSQPDSLSYVFLHQDPEFNPGVMDDGNFSELTAGTRSCLSDDLYLGTRQAPDGDEQVSDISGESPRTFVKQAYSDHDQTFAKQRSSGETLVREMPPLSPTDRAVGLVGAQGQSGGNFDNAQRSDVNPAPTVRSGPVGGGDRDVDSKHAVGHSFVIRAGASTSQSDGGHATGVNGETVNEGAKGGSGCARGRQTRGELSCDNQLPESTRSLQSIGRLNSGRQTDDSFEIDYREMCDDAESDESFELRHLT